MWSKKTCGACKFPPPRHTVDDGFRTAFPPDNYEANYEAFLCHIARSRECGQASHFYDVSGIIGFFDHCGCPLNSREKDHSLFIANSENNPQKEEVIIQSLIQRR
jgi:hypothetical protein